MTARELFDAARALIGKRAVVYTNRADVGFGERQDDGRMRYEGVVVDVAGHAPDGQIDVSLDPREGTNCNRIVRDIASIEAVEPPGRVIIVTREHINTLVDALLGAGWGPEWERAVVSVRQETAVLRALGDAGWGPTRD